MATSLNPETPRGFELFVASLVPMNPQTLRAERAFWGQHYDAAKKSAPVVAVALAFRCEAIDAALASKLARVVNGACTGCGWEAADCDCAGEIE